jgi:hypothetical protein
MKIDGTIAMASCPSIFALKLNLRAELSDIMEIILFPAGSLSEQPGIGIQASLPGLSG